MAAHPSLGFSPLIALTVGERSQVVVTRLRSEQDLQTPAQFIPSQPAFIVVLHLSAVISERWFSEKTIVKSGRYERGGIAVIDLAMNAIEFQSTAFDSLHFYVPHDAVPLFANRDGERAIGGLACPNGTIDPVIHQLGILILETMQEPEGGSSTFIKYALRALLSHLVRAYGAGAATTGCARGGLAPWQTRRATEMLLANVESGAALHAVARHCEMSTSHFVRAFKQTVGHPPHHWRIEQRIELAKKLLLTSEKTVADIGLSVGYSDQASFTRAFKRSVGLAPVRWRRSNRQ